MSRITIEPVDERHAPDIQRLAAHPEVVATTNLPEPYPPGCAIDWIRWVKPRHEAREECAFAVIRGQGLVIGACGFTDIDLGAGSAEYGYWVGRRYWGRGYATEAGRHALEFAYATLGLYRVIARPLARNAASRRVLEKLGFDCLGLTPNPFPKWDDEDRLALYERVRV